MSVRFVTNRFIGDYDPTLETIYRHTAFIDNDMVNFEIMDTAGQEDQAVLLEDKCKWGESFILVYDVTDRCSFDELTRFKFVVSYTHNRLRLNFSPCVAVIGNKVDLADRERMVSVEEGQQLAAELGCQFFREISTKESLSDSYDVFADVWREFSHRCPRSPSNSHRRKCTVKLQDKISVLNSTTASAVSNSREAQRAQSTHNLFASNPRTPTPDGVITQVKRHSSFASDERHISENGHHHRPELLKVPSFSFDRCARRHSSKSKDENDNVVTSDKKQLTISHSVEEEISPLRPSGSLFRRRGAFCKTMSADDVFATRKSSSSEYASPPSSATSSTNSINTCHKIDSRKGSTGSNSSTTPCDSPLSIDFDTCEDNHRPLVQERRKAIALNIFQNRAKTEQRKFNFPSTKERRGALHGLLPLQSLKATYEIGGY